MNRFIDIQKKEFKTALKEITEGRKVSHWIWYIFPQIKGLGYSKICQYYEIESINEAREYLKNDIC